MATPTTSLTAQPSYRWGALTLFAAVGVILAALGFEHIAGYEPCFLCLQQRYAYYVGIPVLFIALIVISTGQYRLAALLFFAVAIIFLANAGFAAYHAGVEWKLWEGPPTCSGGMESLSSGIDLAKLSGKPVVICGEAQVRFLGLSFAGWNVVACVILTIMALKSAFAAAEQDMLEPA